MRWALESNMHMAMASKDEMAPSRRASRFFFIPTCGNYRQAMPHHGLQPLDSLLQATRSTPCSIETVPSRGAISPS